MTNANEVARTTETVDTTDGTVLIAHDESTDMNSPAVVGKKFMMYGAIGFFVVILLFVLCISADAMGKGIIRVGKRLVYADGSGHSSLLVEVLVFAMVLIGLAIYLTQAFMTTRSPGDDKTPTT